MSTPVRVPLMEHDVNQPLRKDVIASKRMSSEATTCVSPSVAKSPKQETPPQHDVQYFRNMVKETTNELTSICNIWEQYQLPESISEADQIMGDIRTTIGQARLVMKERFSQFNGLVNNCEFGTSEKPVTYQDLQGFWDMIFFQVEDVNKKFVDLESRKKHDWKSVTLPPVPKKRKLVKKKSVVGQAAQERREQARKRLAAAKAAAKKDLEFPLSFDAGFFKVNSPVRSIIERTKTPCSKERRKPATPSSGNFMHGRFLKTATENTSSLKKTLDFEEETAEANAAGSEPSPKKEEPSTKFFNCEDAATTGTRASPLATLDKASQTDAHTDEVVNSALLTIDDQLRVIREHVSSALTFTLPNTPRERQEIPKKSNIPSTPTSSIPRGCSPKTSPQIVDAYEPHYKRLSARLRVIEAELEQYKLIQPAAINSMEKVVKVQAAITEKFEEIRECAERLQIREADLNARESKENGELKQLKVIHQAQKELVSSLQQKVSDHDEISTKLKTLVECNDQMSAEIISLRRNCELISADRNKIREGYVRECTEKEDLQEAISRSAEEREFEQAEFANEKKVLEEILEKTEDALKNTTEHMQKLQFKTDESQKQILSLTGDLKLSKQECCDLQGELDMTTNTCRLQILEQQQEVVDCEVKIRDVIKDMECFLGQLCERIEGSANQQVDHQRSVEIALKTPSKSLVVSALRAKNATAVDSPDDGSLIPQETLFTRVSDLQTLTRKILSTSKAVASKYQDELTEMKVVNKCLRENIDALKRQACTRDERDDVEIALRRRLHQVNDEKDRYANEVEAQQEKVRSLCHQIDTLTDQNRQFRLLGLHGNR